MRREVSEEVLKVLQEDKMYGNPVQLRIVSWNNKAPKLEKRMMYRDDSGELKNGKLTGLTADDVKLIIEKKDEILKMMD